MGACAVGMRDSRGDGSSELSFLTQTGQRANELTPNCLYTGNGFPAVQAEELLFVWLRYLLWFCLGGYSFYGAGVGGFGL